MYGDSIMAHQVKPLPITLQCHAAAPVHSIQLLANAPGRVLRPLGSMQESWMEFQTPGFGMAVV